MPKLKKQHIFFFLLIFVLNYSALYFIRLGVMNAEVTVPYFSFHAFCLSCMESVSILGTYHILLNHRLYRSPLSLGQFFLVCYGILGHLKISWGFGILIGKTIVPINQLNQLPVYTILSFIATLLFLFGVMYFLNDFYERVLCFLFGIRYAITVSLYYTHISYMQSMVIMQVITFVFFLFLLLYTLKVQKWAQDALSIAGIAFVSINVLVVFIMNFLHLMAYFYGNPLMFLS